MSAPTAGPAVAPPVRDARRPPERRGVCRDGVRLLAAGPGWVRHTRFGALPDLLRPGDVLVVNTSPTMAAALTGRLAGPGHDGGQRPVGLHVATPLDDGAWVVEVRRPDRYGRQRGVRAGATVALDAGPVLRLVRPYPDPDARSSRLWRATADGDLGRHLRRRGRPVRYGYLDGDHPLAAYQNAYARAAPSGGDDPMPGSAEMASAGRPLTAAVLAALVARGVIVTDVTLRTGLSSPERHEPPTPERFRVPQHTADILGSARARGRRVVAVGTTVVRSLESALTPWGEVRAVAGWTGLVLDGGQRTQVVDALLTGLHEAQASHLSLLAAVAGSPLVEQAYRALDEHDYLWHEFGDSMLLLP